jgi:hypothetical protein
MSLIERAKNIIISPATEWEVIKKEDTNFQQIITNYVIPMALIPAVASFIGYALIGKSIPFVGVTKGISWGISYALVGFLGSLLAVFISTHVIDLLAPSFNSEKNLDKSARLVAYSFTPSWVGGILMIIPSISWLGGLFGLYGIYLLYLGIRPMKETPEDKSVIYLIVSLLVIFAVYFILSAILSSILFSLLGLSLVPKL